MRLDFLVPGLLPLPSVKNIRDLAPALSQLLTRATRSSTPFETPEKWVSQCFGPAESAATFPFAAISAEAEGLADSGARYWLRADPVHLSINRDRIVLLDASQFDITAAESLALIASLQAHFANDHFTISAPHPIRWYIASDFPVNIRTHSISTVRGHSVTGYWFDGPDRALWQTRLSEIQMLLHAHPINDARETAGQLPINGVWFWGEGVMPESFPQKYSLIVGRGVIEEGLAKLASAPFVSTSQFLWDDLPLTSTGNTLVVLDQLDASATYAEWDEWQTTLKEIEKKWFVPALTKLKKGQINEIRIHAPATGSGRIFSASRLDQLKFWRRAQTI